MTFQVTPEPDVEATLKKLAKKDPVRFGQLEKKLRELAENPEIEKAIKKTPARQPAAPYRALCSHL